MRRSAILLLLAATLLLLGPTLNRVAAAPSTSVTTALSSRPAIVGQLVHDNATLAGTTTNANGTLAYNLYTNGACTGTGTVVSNVTVTNAIVPNSRSVIFNSTGAYSWNAVYSGDSNNAGATSACEALNVYTLNILAQPVDHDAGCVAIEEIARGDSIPFLVNVTYGPQGFPMSKGSVKVQLSNGATLNLFYSSGSKTWVGAYPIPWNAATGPVGYTVTAHDNASNTAVFNPVKPEGLGPLEIVSTSLHVNATIEDPTTNQTISTASSGQTVKIVGFVAYPLPGQGFPTQHLGEAPPVAGAGTLLNSTLLSKAIAVVGIGTFNATSDTFSNYTSTKMAMSYESASQSWTATYTFVKGQPSGLYQAAIIANDTSSPSNIGYSLSSVATFGIATPPALSTDAIAFLAAGVLIVGLIVGTVLRPRAAKPATNKVLQEK